MVTLNNQEPSRQIWGENLADDHWKLYRGVLAAFAEQNVPNAIGGGLAFSFHTGTWRDTKDIDLYIEPSSRDAAVEVLDGLGFDDLHSRQPYDQSWIYRGTRDGVIVDCIWQMANHRAQVDPSWIAQASPSILRDVRCQVLGVEELIFSKIYVLQRDRCDWPDLLNLLDCCSHRTDWRRVTEHLGPDLPLLGGLLNVYRWLRPDCVDQFPRWLWPQVGLRSPATEAIARGWNRTNLLDSRPWFALGRSQPAATG